MRLIEPSDWHTLHAHSAIFVRDNDVLLHSKQRTPLLSFEQGLSYPDIVLDRVYLDNDIVLVQAQSELASSSSMEWVSAKQWLNHASDIEAQHMFRACHWLTWDKRHAHCSCCGHPLEKVASMLEKRCQQCGEFFYPSLAPAIIVGIRRNDSILLARGPHFPKGLYSVLAGFVDAGESAEAAVHREVKEEVGITVKNIRYVGTQSWPFPGSFMIAYLADYADGDICIDNDEIEDAQWFQKDNLPILPVKVSLSRRLIEMIIDEKE